MKCWIDIDVLESLKSLDEAGSENFSANLYRVFETEATSTPLRLAKEIAAKDLLAVAQLAHRLKDLALNVGAQAVSQTVEEIGRAAKAGSLADCEALIQALKTEVHETKLEIAQHYPRKLAA